MDAAADVETPQMSSITIDFPFNNYNSLKKTIKLHTKKSN